jgi:hypothetical protein
MTFGPFFGASMLRIAYQCLKTLGVTFICHRAVPIFRGDLQHRLFTPLPTFLRTLGQILSASTVMPRCSSL